MASGMMPVIDTLSYGSQEYHSPPRTGNLSSLEQKALAAIVIGPFVLAASAVVPGTTYFSLAKKGRWAVNQLMRPRVVLSINAAVERQELASMIRGEPQTISIRPHFVVFRSWRWTAWSGFGGVPMLFPWFDIHPKDQKSKSSSPSQSGNADDKISGGGGTKKKITYTGQSGRRKNGNAPPRWVPCTRWSKMGRRCYLRKGHRGRHRFP